MGPLCGLGFSWACIEAEESDHFKRIAEPAAREARQAPEESCAGGDILQPRAWRSAKTAGNWPSSPATAIHGQSSVY
jgi:hypothetical protein